MNSPVLPPSSVETTSPGSFQRTPTFRRSNESFSNPNCSTTEDDEQKGRIMPKSNEVDYSTNPTELFRYINYCEWDHARSRIESTPEEASIWVTRRKDRNGRFLWRYLPIHLVCKRSYYIKCPTPVDRDDDHRVDVWDSNEHLREAELLVDDLLKVYPHSAQEKDNDGMLPLHLCVYGIDENHRPNDMIILSLLLSYSFAVHVQDNYGRTPLDLLREKQNTHPDLDKTLRAMTKASDMINTIHKDLRHYMKLDDGSRTNRESHSFVPNSIKISSVGKHESLICRLENSTSDDDLYGEFMRQEDDNHNVKGGGKYSSECVNVENKVDLLSSCFNDLAAEYQKLLETSIKYDGLMKKIQSQKDRLMENLDRIEVDSKQNECFKQIIGTLDSALEFIPELSRANEKGSSSLVTIKDKFWNIRSNLAPIQLSGIILDESRDGVTNEIKIACPDESCFETPDKSQTADSLKHLNHHRPYPTIKSPLLLEILQQRAKKSGSKNSFVVTKVLSFDVCANATHHTEALSKSALRHDRMNHSAMSCRRFSNFDHSSDKENSRASLNPCSISEDKNKLQELYLDDGMEMLRARYASTERQILRAD